MSKNGKRSRLEIVISILDIVGRGYYKPTNIMFKSNISWVPMMEILDILIFQGLITVKTVQREHYSRREYHITEKGKKALSTCWETLRILGRDKHVLPL